MDARPALITLAARSWSLAAKRLETRLYTTPHLSVSTIRGDGGTPVARGIMRGYEDGNRSAPTKLYVTDPHPTPATQERRLAAWWEANSWTPAAPAAGASSGELEDAGLELALARADGGDGRNGR